ncbi:MAG: type I methionyl aminopeptidase [Candidatus Campbellbacteria bacterium]|nr:type I methionyl aminopeptidase [Candidatus Campbellbacteria bacterium]
MSLIKTPEDLDFIRIAGKRLARILDTIGKAVAPGVSTQELNDMAEDLIRAGGDIPAFLNYKPAGAPSPYPATLCVSINNQAVHGIPSKDRILKEGDIVSLDTGLIHKGRIADMCITVPVGSVDATAKRLIEVTKKALFKGIDVARAGAYVSAIGNVIEPYILKEGFEVVAELGGHGTGHTVHEEPHIFHIAQKSKGKKLMPGMVITIEPTVSEGSGEVDIAEDEWTYKTVDGSRTAQWEHTLIITDGVPEVVTMLE